MKRTIWGLDGKEIMKQVMIVMQTLHAISLMWKLRCCILICMVLRKAITRDKNELSASST